MRNKQLGLCEHNITLCALSHYLFPISKKKKTYLRSLKQLLTND